ncbi:12605_t:CDS:2 [Funneliformis caledonium]|uniref:12605_t:CDS:1 n=1 Tax=Funneliformis caledonium TaxID=1117310 RepID=A0A9N9FC02_9GLOM|nr:12605_t:CDS:2 [Funneliformis caledonium]
MGSRICCLRERPIDIALWLDFELTENRLSYSRALVKRFLQSFQQLTHLPIRPQIEIKPKLGYGGFSNKIAFTGYMLTFEKRRRSIAPHYQGMRQDINEKPNDEDDGFTDEEIIEETIDEGQLEDSSYANELWSHSDINKLLDLLAAIDD